ncbi:hypothetical protein FKM82_012836 [Ascaphus truei]
MPSLLQHSPLQIVAYFKKTLLCLPIHACVLALCCRQMYCMGCGETELIRLPQHQPGAAIFSLSKRTKEGNTNNRKLPSSK